MIEKELQMYQQKVEPKGNFSWYRKESMKRSID